MFDAATAQLLRSAPGVPDLNPQDIPALLTRDYANLVSARLRGGTDASPGVGVAWPADRIADTYELLTSIYTDGKLRRACAFVAGTAQQIVARRQALSDAGRASAANIDRSRVDPTIAATALFLAAEQYADANEAASLIQTHRGDQSYEATILSEHVADLGRGQLGRILERAGRWRRSREEFALDERALAALLETLATGIELLAAQFLGVPVPRASAGRFNNGRAAFVRVLELSASVGNSDRLGGNVLNTYAGPHHLASLLIAAYDGVEVAALTCLPPPDGADANFCGRWLQLRAGRFPFVWPNHREAIAKQFHQTGRSAVVVLPTGAGKTTVSSLKIAGVLARGKKVVFLAPTHALVEQLTGDLQEMFPKETLGSVVSSDFDLLFQSGAQLREIEVMTPERCLAMLSFAPEAFSEVGLLVFDECHLLSPQSGKIRRALDGMLCILGFHHIAPEADFLLLSAMLKNANDVAAWIDDLTGRPCVCVDLLWKPSRQARGVVIYDNADLDAARQAAEAAQVEENTKHGKVAKGLRKAAARKLVAPPLAIWGLQHNWLNQQKANIIISKLLDDPVPLAGDNRSRPIYLKPNANQVAARLAVSAARNGLKAIVFVITKNDAVSVAQEITAQIGDPVAPTETELEMWEALRAEVGDLKHALLRPAIAVPHNSSMLRIERDLAERMFKRNNGAQVIVATPTLAQGLNLPAHLAILAGDKRADSAQKTRSELEAHEILNAAARAGRAGHLANGVVLLIPEPVISFTQSRPLKLLPDVVQKLKSVLPEDDRCVSINDPLEIVLDRLVAGHNADPEVRYVVNRMAALREAEGLEEPTLLFDLRKSLGAFAARKREAEAEFEAKVADLRKAITQETPAGIGNAIALLASQSGLSMDLLMGLEKRVKDGTGSLPVTVEGWLNWTIHWLLEDENARASLLYDVKRSIRAASGSHREGEVTPNELRAILPGLIAYIKGAPLAAIEKELGGDPDSGSDAKRVCPRARELVGNVVPRSLSFVMGLISRIVKEVDPFEAQGGLSPHLVETLGTAMRRGYDSPEKVLFAADRPAVLSRVQMHRLWSEQQSAH